MQQEPREEQTAPAPESGRPDAVLRLVSQEDLALGEPCDAEGHERQRFTVEERVNGLKQPGHGLEGKADHDEDACDDDKAADFVDFVSVELAAGDCPVGA